MFPQISPKYTIVDHIKSGSYGAVYKCRDSRGLELAVKVIKSTEMGIECLIEASIMVSYNHRNIISARDIISKPDMFCICMDLAVMDLRVFCRTMPVTADNLRNISNQCLQGLNAMHEQGMIHCDIKPNNLLIFADGTVKITDFSLSTLKISKNDSFDYKICATNYRPPEVLKGEKWDQAVDIWSMGCTLYEIATGSILVPLQCKDTSIKETDKQFWCAVTLSAINKWRKSVGDKTAFLETVNVIQPHHQITLVEKWQTLDEQFKDLVMSMLTYDPKERPDTSMLLNNSYYNIIGEIKYSVNAPRCPVIDNVISKQIDAYFAKIIRGEDVALVSLTKEIYFRTTNIKNSTLKMDACAWVATKILSNEPMKVDFIFSQLHQVVECEKRICESLGYRLHITYLSNSESGMQKTRSYREFPVLGGNSIFT